MTKIFPNNMKTQNSQNQLKSRADSLSILPNINTSENQNIPHFQKPSDLNNASFSSCSPSMSSSSVSSNSPSTSNANNHNQINSKKCPNANESNPKNQFEFEPEKMQSTGQHPFSSEHIDCICEVLIKSSSVDRLKAFLNSLSPDELARESDQILKAKITLACNQEDFKAMYSLLEGHQFTGTDQSYLQSLWYRAHYLEAQKLRQKPLGAVDKYRIRKRVCLFQKFYLYLNFYSHYTRHFSNIQRAAFY